MFREITARHDGKPGVRVGSGCIWRMGAATVQLLFCLSQAMLFRDFFLPGVSPSPTLFFFPSCMPPVLFLLLAAGFPEPPSPPRMPVTILGTSRGRIGFPLAASITLNWRLLLSKGGKRQRKRETKVRMRDFAHAESCEALLNACRVAFAVGQSNYDIFGCLTVLCTIRPE